MIYLDTSALVSLLVGEVRSERVVKALQEAAAPVAVSAWTQVEFASALALKVRTQIISKADRIRIEARMAEALEHEYELFPVVEADFDVAVQLLAAGGPSLRAGDALHLAICQRVGAQVATLDHEMENAARAFRLATLPI